MMLMPIDSEDGWGEYSKLVLKELETLSTGIKELNDSMNEMKREITEIRAREDKVHELVKWKNRIDEVTSASQLKELTDSVEALKSFKIQAITIFSVVQFTMAVTIFIMNFM